jgi:hypothetical protein
MRANKVDLSLKVEEIQLFFKKDKHVRAACTHPVVNFSHFNWPSLTLKVPYITRIWVNVVE